MSNYDLWNLDADQLRALYDKEMEQLHQLLLSGKSWNDTNIQRKKIANISGVLYKKLNGRNSGSNPAQDQNRDHP